MAVAPMTEETLEKLNQEGLTNEPKTVPAQTGTPAAEGTLPDIDFNPKTPEGTPAEVPAAVPASEPVTTEGVKTDPPAEVFDPFVKRKIEAGGFKVEDVQARMLKDGGITPEFAAELKKTIDPDLVDTYVTSLSEALKEVKVPQEPAKATPDPNIEAQNKIRQELNSFIYDSVGGQEKFTVLAGQLKANLPQDKIDIINAKLASTNKALISEGMREAVQHYKQITGRINNRMEGTPTGPNGTPFTFMTKAQYQKAMTSEKYATDPAYAKSVDEQRLQSMKMDNQSTMPGQYWAVRDGAVYNL